MNTIALGRNKSIHVVLILSILCSFFILPTPAKAGVLSKVWSALRPITKVAGHVGGAVAGAMMASAIVPPLGMIAGGVAGWIVGGMIADYGSRSLSNLAGVAAGVAGAIALGPSAIGIAGGFILGGLLGKLAFSLVKKADQAVTGGVVFNKAQSAYSSANSQALAPVTDVSVSSVKSSINTTINNATTKVQNTTDTLQDKARATKENLVRAAQEKYEKACRTYQELAEKAEKSELVVKAKKAMDTAKSELQELFRR
ncbi:MAG TPA: hypothetical protein PLP29_13925 [Candidatus Ozemobacteraceae bacterium]|nr:hypothetical protein [Candidatus Ozemobacteraceae bacterium]